MSALTVLRKVAPRSLLERLPDSFSMLRLLLVPVLLALALADAATAFLVVLGVSLFSDAADGALARGLDHVTERGARLDSRADLATWAVLPFAAALLRPEALWAEAPWIALLIGSGAAAIATGYLRFRRLTSYHTWGAKLTGVLLAVALVSLFAGGPTWPLRVAALVGWLSQIEEVAISMWLSEWRADVPSFWHARRLR